MQDRYLVHTQCLWFKTEYLSKCKPYPDDKKPLPLDFSYAIVDHDHLKDIFKGFEIRHARFHYYNEDGFVSTHNDTAYEGYDTYVCNLDLIPDSRLLINGEPSMAELGQWVSFDSSVQHEVIKGIGHRHSLVVWAKPLEG